MTPTPSPDAVREAIREHIYRRNQRLSGEPTSDRALHQFEIEEADELLECLTPFLAATGEAETPEQRRKVLEEIVCLTPAPAKREETGTPRTDAAVAAGAYRQVGDAEKYLVHADFARTLERELAEALRCKLERESYWQKEIGRMSARLAEVEREKEAFEDRWAVSSARVTELYNEAMALQTRATAAEQKLKEVEEKHYQLRKDYLDVADVIASSSSGPQDLIDRVRTLRAQLQQATAEGEELRKDKERLDWLENRIVNVSECTAPDTPLLFEHVPAGYGLRDDTDLRKSIDQASAK